MAVTRTVLVEPTFAQLAGSAIYTAAQVVATIDKMTVTNVSASNATVTVELTHGSAVGYTMKREVEAGECYTCPEISGHYLNDGDSITVTGSAGNALVVRVSGTESA